MRHCTTFRAGNAIFTSKSNFSEVSLVHCNLWGVVIQQRVYEPRLYNGNELKCAYGMAQWHWLKHYWKCNWWMALAALSMSAAHNGHYEQLSWQYQYLVSHMTWNVQIFQHTWYTFCNTAWKWIYNIFEGSAAAHLRWRDVLHDCCWTFFTLFNSEEF